MVSLLVTGYPQLKEILKYIRDSAFFFAFLTFVAKCLLWDYHIHQSVGSVGMYKSKFGNFIMESCRAKVYITVCLDRHWLWNTFQLAIKRYCNTNVKLTCFIKRKVAEKLVYKTLMNKSFFSMQEELVPFSFCLLPLCKKSNRLIKIKKPYDILSCRMFLKMNLRHSMGVLHSFSIRNVFMIKWT